MDAPLLHLPLDLHVSVLTHLPACELCSVGSSCRALRDAANADDLWRFLLESDFSTVIAKAFGGVCPPPAPQTSWRGHYLGFATSWMSHARAIGKAILVIDGIVYDVSSYLHRHPGEPELLLAAAGTDASEVFAAIGHTPNARSILAAFAIGESSTLCAQTGGPPAASSTMRTAMRTVLTGLRSKEGRGRLKQLGRTVLSALLHDLTEGRPDCRRYAPAVLRLAALRLCQPIEMA